MAKDWQAKVIAEKEELDDRLKKFTVFVESDMMTQVVDPHDRRLLVSQESLMREYSSVLAQRIDTFKD